MKTLDDLTAELLESPEACISADKARNSRSASSVKTTTQGSIKQAYQGDSKVCGAAKGRTAPKPTSFPLAVPR
jgi:hypothetical protein